MRLLNFILVLQIFNENWRYFRSQEQPKFNEACKDDRGCNRFQYESGSQCSVCAEDKSGKRQCLNNFIDKIWFINQCKIPEKCVLKCRKGDKCIKGGKSFVQACFCAEGYYGTSCTIPVTSGWFGLRMVQWRRANAFTEPGGKTRFYYRTVGSSSILETGLHRVFVTGVGHISTEGDLGREGMSTQSACMDKAGILCTEDYVDLQFPFLLPNNHLGITVLKMGDKLKGYLTSIEAKFKSDAMKQFVSYTYNVFVNYERAPVLKCIPTIQLTNCARSHYEVYKFVFRRNEYVTINYNVKYLEDGAYLSTAKENRQKCTAEDTTWTWTWSKLILGKGLETLEEEGTEIGPLLKMPPFTLSFSIYQVILRIKRVISAATNENVDECFFLLEPLPLKAIIDGGNVRKIIKDAGVSLTATQSYDPNQAPDDQGATKLQWSCECLTKNIPNCENTCKKKHRWIKVEEEFFVPPSDLQYGAEYKFKLRVDTNIIYFRRGIAPQFSYVTVKVANESVKVVTNYYIKCIQNCLKESTLPNEILFLKVRVSVSGKLSHKVNESIEFDWVYYKEGESVLQPLDSIKLADLPTNILAIKENSFEAGVAYTIKLRERNNEDIMAEYSFKTDSMNYTGSCKVDPPSGVKGLSSFDIVCDGVEGYIFEFYDKNEEDLAEKVVFNGRMLGTSEFSGTLRDVRITRGNIEVYIIKKDNKLSVKQDLKVELSPWDITDEIMKKIMENLTSTIRLDDMTTTMKYISFIPDSLPASADKSKILDLLLEPISQVRLNTIADIKLTASTMKIVLLTLNKPTPISVSFELVWKTLVTILRQADILGNSVKQRETIQWMSTEEIKLVAKALLECLNGALKTESASTAGLSEEHMKFDALFMLRQNAHETGNILDKVKDILCYIQAPGLPPAELVTSDKSFHIWAMGNDIDYPVTEMLKKDDDIPFRASQHLLDAYTEEEKYGTDLYFQTALIDKNVFSWSKSDVRSKLVSQSVAIRKKGEDLKKIKLLSSNILVRITMEKNLTNTTVKGSALQLDPLNLQPTDLDMGITIHRIDTPPKGFVTIRFLFPPSTKSLRVLVLEDFRPDYELMMKSEDVVIINSSNPDYPMNHRLIDLPVFLYMGVLPGKDVAVNKTVDYEFEVTLNLCQLWVEGQWSSIGCMVREVKATEETVCECNHLSIFAAAFPVPPQSIDPFGDAKLFLTVLDNPLVVVFIIIIFIIYLLLVLWGRYKDSIDRYKGKVVVLDDNFPEDIVPYLVAVHTSARFNAGTTAHVGIKLMGKEANSRAHILSSERRKVLTRNSDDWFMIYTPKPLGDVHGVHLWHDNYGSRAEWYCDKIVVYDLTERTEAVFIVEQWLALRQGDFPEAHLVMATDSETLNIKRMFLDNSVLGFRDSHTFLSVFVRHPRSQVTRVQRLSILMCTVMVAMLCSIMFYTPDDEESPTDAYQYDVGMRELLVSVQTLVITAALTAAVLISFRRSYKIRYEPHRTTLRYRKDEIAEVLSREQMLPEPKPYRTTPGPDKSFYENYVRYVSKYLKGSPLAPVHMWEDEERVKKRKIWYMIAWVICTVIILGAAYLVMLYGLKLGFVESQIWLTSLVMTMGEDIFIMGPGRIIFIAILLSMAFQVSTKVDLHGISVKEAILARPKNELNYLNILLAKRSHPMYAPLSSSARIALLKKKEIRRQWWSIIDFMNAVCLVVVVSSVISRLWTSHYHGVNHLHNVFAESHKKQFGSVNIENINNISLVESYLEVSLMEMLFGSWWYNDQLMTVGNEPEGIRQYWAEDGTHKPISTPLVRQVRVVPHDCSSVYFKNMSKCLLKWSLGNKDENVYGEKWVPATYLDTTKKDYPWEYRDRSRALWWTNQRFYGTYGTLYDVSGYDTIIGPTLKEARKTLAELRENNWQDWYTRACFMSVTVYNVNEQTFSQITMLFEYFVDGSMFTSMTIIPVSRIVLLGVWELLFVIYLMLYLFRCGYLINRMGLLGYLKTILNITRVIIFFLIFLTIIIWCVHHRKSIKYSEQYMKDMQDDYFDFDKFISTFSLLQVVLSLLLCITIARSFMLLRGGRRILNIYYALTISLTLIFWLVLGFLLLVFVCMRLQYFLDCQEYFRIKELILPQKMTSLVRITLFDNFNVQVFVLLRVLVMYFLHLLFVVLFLYYIRVARAHKPRKSDSFHFVLFVIERVKKCFTRKKKINE